MTDPIFVEEFDTVVDEIAYQYVAGELKLGEREHVEQYFLRSRERRDKVKFASALIDYASSSQGNKRQTAAAASTPASLRERLLAFWTRQGLATRVATAMATILVVAGIAFLVFSGPSRSLTYVSIELAITHGDRAEGAQVPRVAIPPGADAFRIRLKLPEGLPESRTYRVELIDERNVKTELEIVNQDEQAVTIVAPVSDLTSGRYGLHLTAKNPDGTEQRVPGTYRFDIE